MSHDEGEITSVETRPSIVIPHPHSTPNLRLALGVLRLIGRPHRGTGTADPFVPRSGQLLGSSRRLTLL